MFQILDKNSFQVKFDTPKHGMHTPFIQIRQAPPSWACFKENKCPTKYPLSQFFYFGTVNHMTQVGITFRTIVANMSSSYM